MILIFCFTLFYTTSLSLLPEVITVYELQSTPLDTAQLFRPFHRESDRQARRILMENAPLPSGSRIELKVERPCVFDQDRLNLPRKIAMQMDKCWGRVISISDVNASANTDTPACAQVLIHIPFWDYETCAYRSVFTRIDAFFADFAPRQPDDLHWAITRGDIVCGIIQRH